MKTTKTRKDIRFTMRLDGALEAKLAQLAEAGHFSGHAEVIRFLIQSVDVDLVAKAREPQAPTLFKSEGAKRETKKK